MSVQARLKQLQTTTLDLPFRGCQRRHAGAKVGPIFPPPRLLHENLSAVGRDKGVARWWQFGCKPIPSLFRRQYGLFCIQRINRKKPTRANDYSANCRIPAASSAMIGRG